MTITRLHEEAEVQPLHQWHNHTKADDDQMTTRGSEGAALQRPVLRLRQGTAVLPPCSVTARQQLMVWLHMAGVSG